MESIVQLESVVSRTELSNALAYLIAANRKVEVSDELINDIADFTDLLCEGKIVEVKPNEGRAKRSLSDTKDYWLFSLKRDNGQPLIIRGKDSLGNPIAYLAFGLALDTGGPHLRDIVRMIRFVINGRTNKLKREFFNESSPLIIWE